MLVLPDRRLALEPRMLTVRTVSSGLSFNLQILQHVLATTIPPRMVIVHDPPPLAVTLSVWLDKP